MEHKKNSVEILFRHLTVKTWRKKLLLKDVSGRFAPNSVNAILGPSGAGKSTFLDLLAARTSSFVVSSGEILINGRPRDSNWPYIMSYVAQTPHSYEYSTVYETFLFVSKAKGDKSVFNIEEVLKLTGLVDDRDTYFANLSGGQKVRVMIGIELLSKSDILLLDEPLSGLDSAISMKILLLLKKLATKFGKTIVLTVHQPSYEFVMLFDTLSFFSQGRLIFKGTYQECISFFSDNGYETTERQNPIDYYLETISIDFSSEKTKKKSLEQIYTLGRNFRKIQQNDKFEVKEKSKIAMYPRPMYNFISLIRIFYRNTINFIRSYSILLFILCEKSILLLILMGMLKTVDFKKETTSYREAYNKAFVFGQAINFFILYTTLSISSPIYNKFSEKKTIFFRERQSRIYSAFNGYLGNALSDAVINSIFLLVLILPSIKCMGYAGTLDLMAKFILVFVFNAFIAVAISFTIGIISGTSYVAQLIGVLVNFVTLILSNGVVPLIVGSQFEKSANKIIRKIMEWNYMHVSFAALHLAQYKTDPNLAESINQLKAAARFYGEPEPDPNDSSFGNYSLISPSLKKDFSTSIFKLSIILFVAYVTGWLVFLVKSRLNLKLRLSKE